MAKWTTDDLPDLTGRTVLVTGAGSGLGLITARELARAGARVVLGVRTVDKAAEAISGMAGTFEVRHLDVADLGSVRRFAGSWTGGLDVLVNNAGVMAVPLNRTPQGFDVQTATNYFGPFVLTNLLLPRITDRVVSVTSQLHRQGRIDLDDLAWRSREYHPMKGYYDSKLAIVLFSLELQRRLTASGSPARSVLAHPGIASTSLAAHSSSGFVNRLGFLINTPERGALPILYAATQDVPGNAYVGPDGPGSIRGYPRIRKPSAAGLDETTARDLWRATAALTDPGTEPAR
ncbi:SDR family NAD(P)-dependent oxidoreductase [Amycolatopsis sp. lyj-109]|uniref:SDR family NAD(P)-dependent oxidoreductase n=1 Tax=Amycolatopsis sp. lyj-109 TaxID=2789287 RepID=UPI00397E57D0